MTVIRGTADVSQHIDACQLLSPLLTTPVRVVVAKHWIALAHGALQQPSPLQTGLSEGGEASAKPSQNVHSIKELLANIKNSSDQEVQAKHVEELGRLALESPENQKRMNKAGAIVPLVSLLWASPALACKVAAVLAILACDHEENQVKIVQKGAVPPLVMFLQSPDKTLQEQGAIALANLAYDNKPIQDYLVQSEAVEPLVALLKSEEPKVQENAAMALAFIACDNTASQTALVNAGVVENLMPLLESPCSSVQEYAALLLSFLPEEEGAEV